MGNFMFVLFYIGFVIQLIYGEEDHKVLCGDESCKAIISMASTIYRYSADEDWKISFQPGKYAKIFSKYQNGGTTKLFKVDIGGRIGWVPVTGLRETKVHIPKDKLVQVPLPEELKGFLSPKSSGKLQASEISASEREIKESTTPLPAYTEHKIVTKKTEMISDADVEAFKSIQSEDKTIDGTEVPAEELSSSTISQTNHLENITESHHIKKPFEESPSKEEQTDDSKKNESERTQVNDDDKQENNIQDVYDKNNVVDNKKSLPINNSDLFDIKHETKMSDKDEQISSSSDVGESINNQDNIEEFVNDDFHSNDSDNILKSGNVNIENSVADENSVEETEERSVDESSENILEKSDYNFIGQNVNSSVEQTNVNTSVKKQVDAINKNVKDDENDISGIVLEAKDKNQTEEIKENKEESNKDESNKDEFEKSELEPSSRNEEVTLTKTNEESYHNEQAENTQLLHVVKDEMTVPQTKTEIDEFDYNSVGINKSENQSENNLQSQKFHDKEIEDEQNDLAQEDADNSKNYSMNEHILESGLDKENLQNSYNLSIEQSDLIEHEYDSSNEVVLHDVMPTTTHDNNNYNFVTDDAVTTNTSQLNDLESSIEASELPSSHHTIPSENQDLQTDNETEISNLSEAGFLSIVYKFFNNLWSYFGNLVENNEIEKTSDAGSHEIVYSNEEENINNGNIEYRYCEKLNSNSCPIIKDNGYNKRIKHPTLMQHDDTILMTKNAKCHIENDFFSSLSDKTLEMIDLLVCLAVTALTSLVFAFGYYCICHSRRENVLLMKLNIVERSLLASSKEAMVLKHELIETKSKLSNIEDNSLGSNDIVIALKKELKDHEEKERKLEEQITSLEKELENAAEAGLELNKIVSDLLTNQNGDDSILSTVEELQKQLNEQQTTSIQINMMLAEKNKENRDLQLLMSEKTSKLQEEIYNLKKQNEDLDNDKKSLINQIRDIEKSYSEQLSKTVEEKGTEITKLNDELAEFRTTCIEINKKLQASEAKVQALEECLNSIKINPNMNVKDLIDIASLKADNVVLIKEKDSLKERLETEVDAKKLLENCMKTMSDEVNTLKQQYNQSEKERLEAKTRLEVLSNYFKEKETQLQKEISVKEAMWLKHQGETTSTVERVRLMQDEIRSLRSQNDSLRAEIEAQSAAHKAQIATLENRTHENWLAARQSERKYEEARSEAAALRRRLTSASTNPIVKDMNLYNAQQTSVDSPMNEINNTSSPIHMESASSSFLRGLPPPPPFLPPPFMAPPHPFMSLPPPLVPPGEMRPPPLGRLMSPPPPPPHNVYSTSISDDEKHRYSPDDGRRSPDDSKYEYNTDLVSEYDIETDINLSLNSRENLSETCGGRYNSKERQRNFRNLKMYTYNADKNKNSKGNYHSDSEDQCSGW